jgi:hypothetical protein
MILKGETKAQHHVENGRASLFYFQDNIIKIVVGTDNSYYVIYDALLTSSVNLPEDSSR